MPHERSMRTDGRRPIESGEADSAGAERIDPAASRSGARNGVQDGDPNSVLGSTIMGVPTGGLVEGGAG